MASNPTLTRAQHAIVEIAADVNVHTNAEIARRRGVTGQSVGEILRLPEVQRELARREQEHRGKARGFWGAIDKMGEVLAGSMANFNESAINNDPILLGSYLKLFLEAKQTGMKLEAAGYIREAPPDTKSVDRLVRRAAVLGIKIGKGMRVLGTKAKAP